MLAVTKWDYSVACFAGVFWFAVGMLPNIGEVAGIGSEAPYV